VNETYESAAEALRNCGLTPKETVKEEKLEPIKILERKFLDILE